MTDPNIDRVSALQEGVHLQPYLDDIHPGAGETRLSVFRGICDDWRREGGVGIVLHEYTTGHTPASIRAYADVVTASGLQVSVAWGLGQWSSHNPRDAAAIVAGVAREPYVAGNFADNESSWKDEVKDRPAAIVFSQEVRRLAPDACLIGQWFPALDTHSHDADNFGFRDAPALECFNGVAPMMYSNYKPLQKSRAKRYDQWLAGQLTLGSRLRPPVTQTWASMFTLQGYDWDGIPATPVKMVLKNHARRTIVWAEAARGSNRPYPDKSFLASMESVRRLGELGFTGPDAALAFQRAYNASSPPKRLVEDDLFGNASRVAAGLTPAP